MSQARRSLTHNPTRREIHLSILDAFAEFQRTVNAPPDAVLEARRRRDLFRGAFLPLPDVNEVVPSGSLARGTHKDPIHDVDLVVVYDAAAHPEWGESGASAADALDYTRQKVTELLGTGAGSYDQVVRLSRWRNHAVKCFFDDPDDESGFTVDVMPALRRHGRFLVPEAVSADWIECDPEQLIHRVAERHAEWNKFAGSVRMLKRWAADQDIKVKSLVMEVLALDHLPRGVQNQPSSIQRFFVAAAYFIEGGNEVTDPANLCGPIQGDLDYPAFADLLRSAADEASAAIQAEAQNDVPSAISHWGALFGPAFPPAPAAIDPAPALVTPRPVKDTPQG